MIGWLPVLPDTVMEWVEVRSNDVDREKPQINGNEILY